MHSIDVLSSSLAGPEDVATCPAQTLMVKSSYDPKGIPMPSFAGHSGQFNFDGGPPPCLAGMKIYNQAKVEFDRIRKSHHTLAPTGCTPEFCQSGRATRVNEPRVGRDRPVTEIQQEAVGFLLECRDEGIITSDSGLEERIRTARQQIEDTSVETIVTDNDGNQATGLAGGVWKQTPQELEYGIRASWRNARRCIMRSKYEHLILCDLQHVMLSREMAETILEGILEAYNGGNIQPTVFMFPPRSPLKRGPMIWNNQILAFAGYRLEDGSVFGDPANVDITEGMIQLGWKPPTNKSRWDFLPLVCMADGDLPYLIELPDELKRVVQITHPRYKEQFQGLDLKWVLAPALSRFGFDIGGNQYTGSPFIGWFMDAEIGVRNLADTSRYNVLPDVVKALNLSDDPGTPFEDLPEYMKLAALSRAQAELNFAVQHSYTQARVTMIDSLTSSADYQKFDKERRDDTGYRLPADPYWLAPPQGSIVPLWHQGAAPNYQPKPMICRHVQDPIKAWRRENPTFVQKHEHATSPPIQSKGAAKSRIRIFSCSGGINAGKMARKVHEKLSQLVRDADLSFDVDAEKALNALDLNKVDSSDMILIVASTTGRGEMPRNGTKFVKRHELLDKLDAPPRFSVFGNGDTTYFDTYNAAGVEVQKLMERAGCKPLFDHSFVGDTAVNNPDWPSLSEWLDAVINTLQGKQWTPELKLIEKDVSSRALASMPTATLVKVDRLDPNGLLHVTLDLGQTAYQELDHVKILSPNLDADVYLALEILGLKPDDKLDWHPESAYDFLSKYVDFDGCFKTLNWYPDFTTCSKDRRSSLKGLKIKDVLTELPKPLLKDVVAEACKDMPNIRPRLFSVASSLAHVRTRDIWKEGDGNLVDMVVKVNPGGRFSDLFLSQANLGSKLRFGITSPSSWKVIEAQPADAPLIAITTGSGVGPTRALLQRRLADIAQQTKEAAVPFYSVRDADSSTISTPQTPQLSRSSPSSNLSQLSLVDLHCQDTEQEIIDELNDARGPVSLFAGYKAEDAELIMDIIGPAARAGLFGMLELMPSNGAKTRVQDLLLLPDSRRRLADLITHPGAVVFVCGNEMAAEGTARNLSMVAGGDVRELLGERYIEEVFRC